jgi:uncharacterized protein
MSSVKPPAQAPGFDVEVVAVPPGNTSGLRTDVAGFLGRTRRGPLRVGVGATPCRVRIQGQRGYDTIFGGMQPGASTPYAINGYFENEGRVAHVIRLGGPTSRTATALWDISGLLPQESNGTSASTTTSAGFGYTRFQVSGSSPGVWANGGQVTLTYSRLGVNGKPSVDLDVQADGESENIRGINCNTFAEQINKTSVLLRVANIQGTERSKPTVLKSLGLTQTLTLEGGHDDPPNLQTYLDAIQAMGDEPEVGLVVLPDLYDDFTDGPTKDADRLAILAAAVALADSLQDRLVLVDVPPALSASQDIINWAHSLYSQCAQASSSLYQDTARSAAVYHPWLWVPDPLGTTPDESRKLLPPSGHVAGLISRLDRQRGAHYTPANAPLLQPFDVATSYRKSERAVLNDAGIDLIRCFSNQGLLVWGGRTLGTRPGNIFVAHRRLLHRLVRAIRAVALPLVFDVNGPELWLTLVRAITTVLLQTYRAGGLAGDTPAQAFTVQCDDETNPPDAILEGRVLCLVQVAPAIPMEFILLRISLDTLGRLEVLQ